MKILTSILLFFIAYVSTTPPLEIEYCDNCDILLGGLVPVHQKDDKESSFGQCKKHMFNHFAMPRVEALLFAVDQVNKNPNLLVGHKLGIHILDTCGIETIATERAKKFLKNHCSIEQKAQNREPYFAGVIGEMYSSVSKTVATFLQPWKIPQVSPASTSVELSDKHKFKYFARTVPSDKFQFKVIVDILKRLNWTLISTVVSDGSFSEEVTKFSKLAERNGICNNIKERVPKNPIFPDDFLKIVCTIYHQKDSNAVVLFTNVEDTRRILNATRLLKSNKRGRLFY